MEVDDIPGPDDHVDVAPPRRWTRWAPLAAVAAVLVAAVIGALAWRVADDGSAADRVGPVLNIDHWHAAFGIDRCGEWLPNLDDVDADVLGIHSHGDGLIHVHPFSTSTSGRNATLAKFLRQVGVRVTATAVELPDDTTLRASDGCDGQPAEVVIESWSADAVRQGGTGRKLDSADHARIAEDGMAFVLALVPVASSDRPALPPSVAQLADPLAAEGGGTIPSWLVPPGPTTTVDTTSLAPGEVLLDPQGTSEVHLGDVIEPAADPTYADGSPAAVVAGRPVDRMDSVAHMCDWSTDTTSRPGITLTLETTSVGRVVVGVRPDHPLTPEGLRPGMSVEELLGRFRVAPYPPKDAAGAEQLVVGVSDGSVPYAFHLDPSGMEVVGVSVEDGINSPVLGVACH